jgi:hypothetical protein
MVKTFFDPYSGKHRIKDHEDIGGFDSRKEAQEHFKRQAFLSGKADGYTGYPKEEYKNTDYPKSHYLKGHAEGVKEHEHYANMTKKKD